MKNTLAKTTHAPQLLGWRKARPGEVGPQPIWLAQGGSEEDAGGDGTDTGDDDTGNGDEGAGGAATDDKSTKDTVSKADFDRVSKHLSNADRKKAAAELKVAQLEKELNDLKTKDLPDAEKIKLEHETVVKERDSYRDKFQRLARTNAFLLASEAEKVSWANSSAALRVGDLEDLEIEEDGTVPGMREAVKSLAKEHPYLLAPKDSTDTDNTKDAAATKTGSVVGSRQKGKKVETEYTPEDLRRMFPALRS